EEPMVQVPRAARLSHLDGARTLLSIWIVCHHMAPREPASSLDAMLVRVDVGVEFFMMMSGFLTQHLFGQKEGIGSSAGSLASFYTRRLFRCLLVAYLGMGLCALLQWLIGLQLLSWKTAGCFAFVKTWVDPMPDCPNMPSWFVAALLPSWLLYPFVLHPLLAESAGKGFSFYLWLSLLCWLLAIGPQLCLMSRNVGWLDWEQFKYVWFWPPAQMPDFALGACIAALVRVAPPSRTAGRLGDLVISTLVLVCLVAPVPEPPADWTGPSDWRLGHYIAWEQLAARLSAPLLGFFLYCSAGGESVVARLLSHGTLVSLGNYTLEIYLLQMPLHDVFLWLRPPGGSGLWKGLPWNREVFGFFLTVLVLLCGLFVEFVAEPLNQSVKTCTSSWAGHTLPELLRSTRRRYQPLSAERDSESEADSSLGLPSK
ncbi:unnamed protein product, partial [Polarella glacialis]